MQNPGSDAGVFVLLQCAKCPSNRNWLPNVELQERISINVWAKIETNHYVKTLAFVLNQTSSFYFSVLKD
jgi:hypothetical protein